MQVLCKSVLVNIGWEAICWEAPWLGSHLLGSTLTGKPRAGKHLGWEAILSGKTQGGLFISYPLPSAAVSNSQALSDLWHDFFQIVVGQLVIASICISMLNHSGWESTCWEAFWLGSHLRGSPLAGKPSYLGRLRVGGVAHQLSVAQCCEKSGFQ